MKHKVVGYVEWLREERGHSVKSAGGGYKIEKSSQLAKFVSLGCCGKRQYQKVEKGIIQIRGRQICKLLLEGLSKDASSDVLNAATGLQGA